VLTNFNSKSGTRKMVTSGRGAIHEIGWTACGALRKSVCSAGRPFLLVISCIAQRLARNRDACVKILVDADFIGRTVTGNGGLRCFYGVLGHAGMRRAVHWGLTALPVSDTGESAGRTVVMPCLRW
jgi:hypothetical protein